MRVLVIDDERPILSVVERILVPKGYEVFTAESASEAFLLLASLRCSFDVILCDVQMPRMTGGEFLARLGPLDAARLVLMTGGSRGPFERRGLPGGQLLMKPFDGETLTAAILDAARRAAA
jgi:CheY-like chemotaxis protein